MGSFSKHVIDAYILLLLIVQASMIFPALNWHLRPIRWCRSLTRQDRFTFFLVLFTALLAISTALLFYEGLIAANQQHKDTLAALSKTDDTIAIMQEQQRPWIDFAIGPTKDITFVKGGNVSAGLTLAPINKGQMPAFDLRVAAILVPMDFRGSKLFGRDYQAETCGMAEAGGGSINANNKIVGGFTMEEFNLQNVLFPDKNTDGDDIKKTRVDFNFLEAGDKYILKQPWPPEYFGAELIGCIAYHINTLRQKWHHTKFDLELGKKTGGFLVVFDTGVIASMDLKFSVNLASSLNDAD